MKTFTHRPLRSIMAATCEHAANVGKKAKQPFTLRDFLRNKKLLDARQAVFDKAENKRLVAKGPNRKVTVIKMFKNRAHATGIGEIPATDIETLRLVALSEGYSHYRLSNRQTIHEL